MLTLIVTTVQKATVFYSIPVSIKYAPELTKKFGADFREKKTFLRKIRLKLLPV